MAGVRRARPGLSAWDHAALAVRLADATRLSGQVPHPAHPAAPPGTLPRNARATAGGHGAARGGGERPGP
jgi:hypothetical protein